SAFVRYHQVRVDPDHLAVPFTAPACPIGVVEREKIGAGLLKDHSVQLKALRKMSEFAINFQKTVSPPFKKPGLNGICQTVCGILLFIQSHPINEYLYLIFFGWLLLASCR